MKMKKTVNRSLALLLVLALLFGSSMSANALYADSAWQSYYADYMADGHAVIMNPGSDDTQRNFSWYSASNEGKAKILLSESPEFTDAKTFTGKAVRTPEGDRANKITVSGLEAGKTYYYRCCNGDTVIKEDSFRTIAGKEFTAVYMTDIHISRKQDGMEEPLMNQAYTYNTVLQQANAKAPFDLILSSGDQASYGDRREYMSLASATLMGQVPFALAVGNHDRKGIAYKYFNNNPNKYTKGVSSFIGNDYWYVKGDVLFMVFDSNNSAAMTHRAFAKAAVAANPDVKWRVAVMHHDLYGRLSDSRAEEADETQRPVFVPIFDEFKVDLVLLGHSHYFSISNGMVDGEITDTVTNNSLTDPAGSVYVVSNSINHPRDSANAAGITPAYGNAIAIQKDGPVYNMITFSEDSVTVNTYELNADEPFNTFILNKTTQNGGHKDYNNSPNLKPNRTLQEFLAFWTEFGQAVSAIWKNYFDR